MNRQSKKNRRRSRRALSILMVFAMLFTLTPAAGFAAENTASSGAGYTDVAQDAWYKDAVDYVTDNGLLVGVADDQFGPEQNVTRAMVVTVMWRQSGAPASDGETAFTDVPDGEWYTAAVAWGADNGMVAGMSDTTFEPNTPVTREQLVAFMQRFAQKNGEDTSVGDGSVLDAYTDADAVSDWAENAMIWALENGVISGMTDTTIAPQGNATRAQYAAILQRTGATISDEIDLSGYEKLSYYHNGKIITVDENVGEDENGEPIYAKAVLAGDGIILAVAYTDEEVAELTEALAGLEYEDVDLNGETMIPAFVDAHGHIDMTDQFADASPSSGVTSLEALVEIGKQDFDAWVNDHTYDDEYGPNEPGGKFWFVTNGFDNTVFKDGWEELGLAPYAMPTREVLDQISTEYPICYIHASSHLGVVNSLGMELYEQAIAENESLAAYANPSVNWDVDENGEYTGVVREGGFYALAQIGALWNPTTNRTASSSGVLENAMDVYASYGIATAVAGGGGGDKSALMDGIPEDERIIDIISLMSYDASSTLDGVKASADRTYDDTGLKYGAVKLFGDGSPQGKTAWFAEDDSDTVSGGGYYRDANETLLTNEDESTAWWWGQAEGQRTDDATLTAQFTDLVSKEISFHVHANGTGAIQQFIDCYRQALINNGVDVNDDAAVAAMADKIRPVVIHSQTITDAQMQEAADLGMILSFFTDHVFYYGDYHLYSTLGPDRGQLISPMGTALSDGIVMTMHQDSPIAPPNMLFSVYNAATRITRDGQPIGRGSADGSSDSDSRITDWSNKSHDTRDERISAYEALKCVTINSAWQQFDEDEKGSISVGKQADFAILNVNPLTDEFLGLDPEEAQTGEFVEQTINDDEVVYDR